MSYNVQLGMGGYLGWKVLERTESAQKQAFSNDRQMVRAREYYSEKMPNVKDAESFVSDYRLMSVAMRAYGLDSDVGNRAFIKKVLDSDPNDSSSLVNRLSDKRYLALNKALRFSAASGPIPDIASIGNVLDRYTTRSFEKNIGQSHSEIELALNARRELSDLAGSGKGNNTAWYQILASAPLRKVFEGALGLSSFFSTLPVDRQLAMLKERAGRSLGSDKVSQFSNPDNVEKLIKNYLLKSGSSGAGSASPYAVALAVLQLS